MTCLNTSRGLRSVTRKWDGQSFRTVRVFELVTIVLDDVRARSKSSLNPPAVFGKYSASTPIALRWGNQRAKERASERGREGGAHRSIRTTRCRFASTSSRL